MTRILLIACLFAALSPGCSGRSASDARHPSGDPSAVAWPTRTSCDALVQSQRQRASVLLATLHAHDCCDETLALCLQHERRCLLAVRLAENVCRRVAQGQDEERIRLALSLRARMMMAAYLDEAADIDLSASPAAGDPEAPVTVVEYAGPRGTNCASLTPRIHAAVAAGPLEGKARLYLKPFPLRSNPHSREAGIAFMAAQELGGLWEFVLHSYARFEGFDTSLQPEWAEAVGLDRERFEQLLEEERIVQRLVESKMEGLDNGVDSTPTFFIDGRRYLGELETEELVDTLEEAYERSQGLVYEP